MHKLPHSHSSRIAFDAALLLVVGLIVSCTDGVPPIGLPPTPTTVLAVNSAFGPALTPVGSGDIHLVRVVAVLVGTDSILGSVNTPVDPTASEWKVDLNLSVSPSAPAQVIISVELINLVGIVESVEWSGAVGPVGVAAGSHTIINHVAVFRGPLSNLSVTEVSIEDPIPPLLEGSTAQLSATSQSSQPTGDPRFFWASLDPGIADVTSDGLLTGIVAGPARIVVTAGAVADTAVATVLARRSPPPYSGLVAWWPGDGHYFDMIGESHGTPQGDVTVVGQGVFEEAFSFDGNGDGVLVEPLSEQVTAIDRVTLAAWVNLDPAGDRYAIQRFVTLGDGSAVLRQEGGGPSESIDQENILNFYMQFENNPGLPEHIRVNNALQPGCWDLVVGSYDGEWLRAYKNGIELGSLHRPAGEFGGIGGLSSQGYAKLGASGGPGPPAESMYGSLDEVMVFDRPLSQAEVQAMYAASGGATRCAVPWTPPAPITFNSNVHEGIRDIFVMDQNGIRQLTSGSHSWHSVFSANSQIAFMSSRDGDWEIYSMNPDGSGQTNLTNHPGNDARPTYSPDGQRIAFMGDRDGDWEIYVMNSDGSGVTQLTTNESYEGQPRWSQAGPDRIAYTSDRDGTYEIYTIDVSTGVETRLTGTEGEPGSTGNNSMATWSPDGGQLAFVSNRGGSGEIYVMASDGSNPTRLTEGGGFRPSWSADGQRIVFNADRDQVGGRELYIMNANGSGLARIPWLPSDSYSAFWHPNPASYNSGPGGSPFP